MIWNLKENKEKSSSQCVCCSFFDKKLKTCNGFGKKCFEIDPKTKVLIDPKTGLGMSENQIKTIKEKING